MQHISGHSRGGRIIIGLPRSAPCCRRLQVSCQQQTVCLDSLHFTDDFNSPDNLQFFSVEIFTPVFSHLTHSSGSSLHFTGTFSPSIHQARSTQAIILSSPDSWSIYMWTIEAGKGALFAPLSLFFIKST